VSAVEGVTCHSVKRFVLAAGKEVPIKPRVEEKVCMNLFFVYIYFTNIIS
jgi:hypothetical protein